MDFFRFSSFCIVVVSDSENGWRVFENLFLIIRFCFAIIVFFCICLFDLIDSIFCLCGVITTSYLSFPIKYV